MKYLESNYVYGRLANQLYVCLHAFVLSQRLNDKVKALVNLAMVNYNLVYDLLQLGMKDIIQLNTVDITNDSIIHICQNQNINYVYKQLFNIDFSLTQLEEFIGYTILQSNMFKETINKFKYDNDKVCAIHIRNTDYLQSPLDCFNRRAYIEIAIAYMKKNFPNIDNIVVFSDDINICKQQYDNMLKQQFSIIEYNQPNDAYVDLLKLSCFKHKILFNSTFSYWSAFISNVVFPNSYLNIVAPSKFGNDTLCDHCNPLWIIIKV